MSTIELRKKLIEKIKKTENENLLGEVYRLLEIETLDIDIYKLNESQIKKIAEARKQIKNGQYLTDKEANKEINEWLKK
jgi:cell division protein FtsX